MISFENKELPSDGSSPHRSQAAGEKFVLAHLSDPHIACVSPGKKRDLLNKRLLGYLRWRLFRKRAHQDEFLALLQEDLMRTGPDHIVVTGDLTHLGLPAEFKKAQMWLRSLGTPAQVTVVPGNHDTYVRSDWNQTFAWWLDYMVSDRPGRNGTRVSGFDDLFPTLRVRGPVALIGVCSAHPSAPHLAVGTMGAPQLNKLETVLKQTAAQGLFRIVAIHHPPLSGMESWRRRLKDGHSLHQLVARCGAELILHGHVHKAVHHTLSTPSGQTTVVGATSASSSSLTDNRRACYYVHTLLASETAWDVHLAQRVYCPEARGFIPGKEEHYRFPAPRMPRAAL
jgi:3',5'-cyclic AMP phosphodiesterase CpdA